LKILYYFKIKNGDNKAFWMFCFEFWILGLNVQFGNE
jgi:hypothetical protein